MAFPNFTFSSPESSIALTIRQIGFVTSSKVRPDSFFMTIVSPIVVTRMTAPAKS